jgi:hypothetical protein
MLCIYQQNPERLNLLPHILHLVIDPPAHDKACEIRKITLREFRRMTYEQLGDKINDDKSGKKEFLDGIFGVAIQLQRYKRGEIGQLSIPIVIATYPLQMPHSNLRSRTLTIHAMRKAPRRMTVTSNLTTLMRRRRRSAINQFSLLRVCLL